ncbi:MAG: glycosyltransferase [Candidatus Magnetomorum sp.]|nr:glycosyltransferase [Candidatus Magnetomorum sp.]
MHTIKKSMNPQKINIHDPKNVKSQSILIVDPQVDGHHLTWIRYVTTIFLNHNFHVTLMTDLRDQSRPLIEDAIADKLNDICLISAFNENGHYRGGNCLNSISLAQKQTPSNHIFMNELDLVASTCLRKTAIGFYPPKTIKGAVSGVYFRPRFLSEGKFSFSNMIKSIGFRKLCRNQWFKNIFLMDEQRIDQIARYFPTVAFHLLPDPWDGDFSINQNDARSALNLPDNRFILLQFGIGTRRKGLHLVIEAMNTIPESSPVFLLCAGKLSIDSGLRDQLERLEKQNRAIILDRYVSQQEEKLCFCAADTVLLPYVDHFGSSGVLSRAAASGKPVIASDYDLTGWRVHQYELGLIFQSNDSNHLRSTINIMASMDERQRNEFHHNALTFAQSCSLDAFERALVEPFNS